MKKCSKKGCNAETSNGYCKKHRKEYSDEKYRFKPHIGYDQYGYRKELAADVFIENAF